MSENDGFVNTLLGGAAVVMGGVVVLFCLGAGGCWFGAGQFLKFGIASDLEDYRREVASSDLSPGARDEVLARLERIDTGVRSGRLEVPFMKWIDYDQTIEALVSDGQIPEHELAALHDELNRIESHHR